MKLHIIRIFIFILFVIGIYCAFRYEQDVIQPEIQISRANQAQQELFANIRPEIPSNTNQNSKPIFETASDSIPEENPLSKAEKINSNIVGWLTIPETNIDYPIVQGTDNDFYLHHGFDGIYNYELGCPFLDYRCMHDFSGFNSIIYAHHMTKQRMFADIALYKERSFMEQHPIGYLTLPDGIHELNFFAYLTVSSNDAVYQAEFQTESEYQTYLNYLLKSANYILNLDFSEELPHLILLSTCTFEYDEARGILVGIIL